MKKNKNITGLIMAAIVGSAITLGAFQILDLNNKTLKIEHVAGTPSMGAMYTTNEEGEVVPLDFTKAAERVMPAVVHIRSTQMSSATTRENPRQIPDPFRDFFDDDFYRRFFGPDQRRQPQPMVGSGSGVIINSEGYIVTNNHVVDNADDIEVILPDNRTYKAKVIGTDPTTDLALIQIKETGLPYLSFVNSDDVKVGEWVLAVGNPFNLNSTVTAGIVSAKARNINILRDRYAIESFIQTDAAINRGNSGGALVNLQGGLIGINTAIASPTGAYSGYGFAVPSNIVSKVVEDLLKYGVVQRGFLGVTIRGLNGTLARELDLNITEGVYVDSVSTNSAAEDSGIKPGDVIIEVNGQSVESAPELQEIIARHRPGDEVTVKVNRDGKIKSFDVILKNREGEVKVVKKEELDVLSVLGVKLETVDKATARKLEIEGGVKVTDIGQGKIRRHTDMREGFIITKINDQEVTSAEQVVKILENRKGGVMLEGVYEDYPGRYYYAFGL